MAAEAPNDREAEGRANNSVIRTLAIPQKSTSSDDDFLAPEGTPREDRDYEQTEDTDGTDRDDEEEDEEDGGARVEA